MIKTSIIFSAHTLHVLHVVLRDTLIVVIVLLLALFSWLKYGIHTEALTLGKYSIEGLYIKLDKKLTLKANKIIIPRSKKEATYGNIEESFEKIKYIFKYFDSINLKEVDFNDNKVAFLYADDVLYITTDDYEFAGNVERKGNRLIADIALFYIKKEKINLNGKIKYFLNKDRIEIEGAYDAYNINGHFAAYKENDEISFAVNSENFTDLKTLTSKLPVEEVVKSWIAEKVTAKRYKLDSFVGKAHIVDDDLKVDTASLHADLSLQNVKIYYKEKLAPIVSKEVKMMFKNHTLSFDLQKPTYKKRRLDGSKIAILHLGGDRSPILDLDLQVKSKIDSVVQNILKAYQIYIPVTQTGKDALARIHLMIPLSNESKSKTKVAVNVKLDKGTIIINDSIKLPVLSGNIFYVDGIVTLKNVSLKDKWYTALANAKINVKKKRVALKLDMSNLELGKEKIFTLKNKVIDVQIDYGKKSMKIPVFGVEMQKEKDLFVIKLKDLKKIKPYLKDIDIQMDGGSLDIVTKDFKTYTFSGVLQRNACFFYDKKSVCHTKVPCRGTVSEKKFVFHAFNDRLSIDLDKAKITVHNLNIDLKAFFESRLKKSQNAGKKAKSTEKMKALTILGKKSNIRYEEYTLVTDAYRIYVSPNGNISATGRLGKDTVKLLKKGKNITVEAIRVSDAFLHPLINFNGLRYGRYTFKSYGDPEKLMHGEIIIEGGVMKDFKAYNNTLAFINTLPALATLHSPGFSQKGFTIKKGVAKYRKIGEKIIFDDISIEGASANFVGQGMIDLKKNTIDINIAIQIARELGSVVGSVPVLGYILMGDDKSMTVGLKISGSLSKPKVTTSATKEILKLPLDLIKRTLESPSHILDQKPKVKKQPPLQIEKRKVFNRLAP